MKAEDVKEPGYYWYENPYGSWKVLEVSRVLGDLYATSAGCEAEDLITELRGDFLGPIKPIVTRF